MQILKGRQQKPRRVLLYGQEGVGKSTWAASAPRPLFLNFEDGLGDLDVESTPRLNTYSEAIDALRWLYTAEHGYQSVVFDTVDWFEKLIFDQVCHNANTTNIEKVDGGYGKGYTAAATLLQEFLGKLEKLMAARKLNVILLGHCTRVKVTDPEREAYEKHAPDIHKQSSALLREWCDEVFYASFRTYLRTEDSGFNKTRQIAIGGDERFIRTTHSAGVHAKNRLNLPAELPMAWSEYQKHWPNGGNVSLPPSGNVAGLVVNGTSKVNEEVKS
jgi:hypothetical protein